MSFEFPVYTPPDFTKDVFAKAPEAKYVPAPKDEVAPEQYHATTIFPEYFKVDGRWLLAKESRMDCVAVLSNGEIEVREFRRLKQGDLVFTGRTENAEEGIFVQTDAFTSGEDGFGDAFAFRQGRSRETSYSKDYDSIYELLRHEKEQGYITWVLGPACAFDADARNSFSRLVQNGYVDALLAGNALATHDLEAAYLKTALGQNIYTQKSQPGGHYNHIDTINKVKWHGSIPKFIEHEKISDGIIYSCVKNKVPFVLTGSIRDDGPLPEVYADVYEGQDKMRECVKQSTTVICMATTLHSIAAGNMTPSYRVMPDGTVRPVYFYSVDISEFAVNKLRDRGSLAVKTIVTNVQDFVVNISKGLGLE
ncbi:hypothetical protein [Anaerolentibacter hominis]|uniref:ornithine cyclodeaminase family domain n=1 Tax=Anaerolentibacter hominis TaxID=3079009 RepID=UPI0031B8626D